MLDLEPTPSGHSASMNAPTLRATVLVADDEPSMLSLISQHVRTLGHTVHLAHDGEEAWEQVQTHRPDLVLLDVMMPAMSGWEVCRKIREDKSLSKTAVVMITGIGERLNEMTSPLFGADRYLDKPFELVDLDEAIAVVLAKRGGGTKEAPKAEPSKKAPAAKKPAAKPAKPAKKAAKPVKKVAAKPAKKAAPKKIAPKAVKKAAPKPAKKAPAKSVKKATPKAAKKPLPRAAKSVKKAPAKKAAKPAKKVAPKKAAKKR